MPGDDEAVDDVLSKHPEDPLASDHDDELDDYFGPTVSTVGDERGALNHHAGGQTCVYVLSLAGVTPSRPQPHFMLFVSRG